MASAEIAEPGKRNPEPEGTPKKSGGGDGGGPGNGGSNNGGDDGGFVDRAIDEIVTRVKQAYGFEPKSADS